MQEARFELECGRCVGDIDPGDPVEYDSSLGWVHADSELCEELEDAYDNDFYVDEEDE